MIYISSLFRGGAKVCPSDRIYWTGWTRFGQM